MHGSIFSLSWYCLPSVLVCVLMSSSYKDSSPVGLRTSLMTLFWLITSLKTLPPSAFTFWGPRDKGFNKWILRGHSLVHSKILLGFSLFGAVNKCDHLREVGDLVIFKNITDLLRSIHWALQGYRVKQGVVCTLTRFRWEVYNLAMGVMVERVRCPSETLRRRAFTTQLQWHLAENCDRKLIKEFNSMCSFLRIPD